MYPSNLEDWQSLESIVDVFDCYHRDIGEELYKDRTYTSLADSGIFFYDHFYTAPTRRRGYGQVRELPLPEFNSTEWPLPCSSTSEAYRCKMFTEIQKCMKPNISCRQCRVNVFMPIGVFVDFFSNSRIRTTKTMMVVQSLARNDMLQFLDKGWDTKEDSGITCKILEASICCKYMISTQNFIVTFFYRRWHCLEGRLVPLEQDLESFGEDPLVELDILYDNRPVYYMSIREECTLRQVRADLLHKDIQLPQKYYFQVNGVKVNLPLSAKF